MPETEHYSWRTPDGQDKPRVAHDLAELADQIDQGVDSVDARVPFAMFATSFSYGAKPLPFYATYTFPAGKFTLTPLILLSRNNTAGGTPTMAILYDQASPASVRLGFYGFNNVNSGWCQGNMIAIQMKPGGSSG